jgi:hypothetical protein
LSEQILGYRQKTKGDNHAGCNLTNGYLIFPIPSKNYSYNNNNQAFYSQASWGRLEMKPHEPKKQGQNKSEKGGKQWANYNCTKS